MRSGMRFLAASRARANNTNTTEGITNPAQNYQPHSNYEMESRGYKRYDNGRFAPHNEMEMGYGMESRRYDNGRFAPRNGGERYYDIDIVRNGMESEMQGGYRNEMRGGYNRGGRGQSEMEMNNYGRSGMEMNRYGRNEMEGNGERMEMERRNPVGFNARFDSPGQTDASYHRMQEGNQMHGPSMQGGGAKSHGSKPKFNEKMAREWTAKMQNEDGTKGPHWTIGQIREVLEDRGITGETAKWWVVMNMMYSDYCKVAQKLGVNIMDFCVEMTKAFCEDKDAGAEDKVAAYYEYVVKGA